MLMQSSATFSHSAGAELQPSLATSASAALLLGVESANRERVSAILSDAQRLVGENPGQALELLNQAFALLRGREQTAPEPTIARGGLTPWQCRKVEAHIGEKLGSNIGVEELAKLVRLSMSHFSRAFKISFEVTPYAYIIRKRVELAQTLMLETEKSLSEIALDCGLSDQAHLSNLFRRSVGTSPNSWRRRSRQERSYVRPVAERASQAAYV